MAKISFTGSAETGRKVIVNSADTLKRLTLELGGNDAAIVLPDVDIKETAAKIYGGAFLNAGQVCLAIKRAYVHEEIYDHMVDALADIADSAVIDDVLKQGTTQGPVQNREQFEKVKDLLESVESEGRIAAGGDVPPGDGHFVSPAIVRDVSDGDRIVDEEQFGPVLPVIKFTDIDEVVARANNSDYGLGGSVWSADFEKAAEIAGRIEAGRFGSTSTSISGLTSQWPAARAPGSVSSNRRRGLRSSLKSRCSTLPIEVSICAKGPLASALNAECG